MRRSFFDEREGRGTLERVAPLLLVMLAVAANGCGGEAAPTKKDAAASRPAVSPVADFAIRGRWEDPRRLSVKIDETGLPLTALAFKAAVDRALGVWSATGVVGFRQALPSEAEQVLIAFRDPAHGDCRPFVAWTGEVAHTTAHGPRIEIHLDRSQEWSEDGRSGKGAFQAILHELGHVVGLEHSGDEAALMHPRYDPRKTKLESSDVAGIHTLYGGGPDMAGDTAIGFTMPIDGDPEARIVRAFAPRGRVALSFFDLDGDGRDELIARRIDQDGLGAFRVLHLSARIEPVETRGPFLGLVPPGRFPLWTIGPGGRRMLLSTTPTGAFTGYFLTENGTPSELFGGGRDFRTEDGYADLDGDSVIDPPAPKSPEGEDVRGTIDGREVRARVLR